MKFYELLDLPGDELRTRLQNAKMELSNLRFQKATHQIDNPLQIRVIRREIAQINTLINEYTAGTRKAKHPAKSSSVQE